MIESVTLPSIHTNGQYNKNSEALINNSFRLKFPFHIKPVDPIINKNLLKDFTGTNIFQCCNELKLEFLIYFYLKLKSKI